jgi:hypothetical protein
LSDGFSNLFLGILAELVGAVGGEKLRLWGRHENRARGVVT